MRIYPVQCLRSLHTTNLISSVPALNSLISHYLCVTAKIIPTQIDACFISLLVFSMPFCRRVCCLLDYTIGLEGRGWTEVG